MIILANHSHICWAREQYGQTGVFKNTLNRAQILREMEVFKITVSTGAEVSTFVTLWIKA